MNLKSLETFYMIAQLGSFHAAAARFNMTQAAVSVRIRELERSLDVKLFDRSGRSTTLTAKGRELVAHAERVLSHVSAIFQQVGNSKTMTGQIRIGAGEVASLTWLPAIINELSHSYPRLIIDVDVDLAVNLQQKLNKGDIDIGIILGPVSSPDLRVRSLIDMPMTWSIGTAYKPAPPDSLSMEELAAMPIISLPRDTHMHILIEDWFAQSGLAPFRMYSCNLVSVMQPLVECGFGAAILPKTLIKGNKLIRPLDLDCPMDTLHFVSAVRRRDLSGLVGIVEDLICERCSVLKFQVVEPAFSGP
jgi:DNA-binding transcriptional LysR family regulator